MVKPTYDELLAAVTKIASFIYDGDALEEPTADGGTEHEMSIDDAFETCSACRDICRDLLGTDGSDLPRVKIESA